MQILLHQAKPGMLLSEDLVTDGNVMLAAASTPLTEILIDEAKNQGITRVSIIDERKPRVSVKVSLDKMSAHLTIESGTDPDEVLTIENINTALNTASVKYGIKESKFQKIIADWNSIKEPVEIRDIAAGTEAQPSKEGGLDVEFKHIRSDQDLEFAKKSTYCWELYNEGIQVKRVEPKEVIGTKIVAMPAIPGKNVLDEDLFNDEKLKIEIEADENVTISDDESTFSSKIKGIVYFIDNRLGVIPINFDGSAEIEISDDKMQAFLAVHPAMEGGNPVEEKEIKKLFAENHINFGIKNDILTGILQGLAKGETPSEPILIAEGVAPQNGEDAKIEYLFSTETSLKPKEDEKGNVDYKSVSIIQTVSAGDELAKIHPPTAGEKGMDIFGKEIPCKPGKEVNLPQGENTEPKEDDPKILKASIDGNVRLNRKNVEIYEGFVVNGDVSYATGNIEYEKSVIIKGDVKAGFNIVCGGDLEVEGSIEDSEIIVGGNLLCKYGFIGHGDGVIRCKGDVNLGFIKNQSVYARGNVNIAKEAINPTIYCRHDINISGQHLSVAGGILVARDNIHVQVIGNDTGVKTILEVGLDFTLIEEKIKTEDSLKEIKGNRKKLSETSQKFERILVIKKKLPPKDEFLYKKLMTTINKYDTQIRALEERMELITKKMRDYENAIIKVEKSAMPGTVFKIGERQHLIRDELIGPKTIRMINFEIKIF